MSEVATRPLTRGEFLAAAAALHVSIAGYRQNLAVFCDTAVANIDQMTLRLERLLDGVDTSSERVHQSPIRQYFRGR